MGIRGLMGARVESFQLSKISKFHQIISSPVTFALLTIAEIEVECTSASTYF